MTDAVPQTTLKIAISGGPECPHCRLDMFDDWHLEPSLKMSGGLLQGRMRCHGCGKFFSITQYSDGETHSTARSKVA